jgi:hypothetical protein
MILYNNFGFRTNEESTVVSQGRWWVGNVKSTNKYGAFSNRDDKLGM